MVYSKPSRTTTILLEVPAQLNIRHSKVSQDLRDSPDSELAINRGQTEAER